MAHSNPLKSRGWLRDGKHLCILIGIVVCGIAAFELIRYLPYIPAYRHFRVIQSKPIVDGANMCIDDLWMVRFDDNHQYLRVLCHWVNGFPPDEYALKATLRVSATGPEAVANYTWYVPLPKTTNKPNGTTFFWELRDPPTNTRTYWLRVYYWRKGTYGVPKQVDFKIPNVAVRGTTSVPFEPIF